MEAVKNHRVLIFDQDYAFVPGPRFIRLVEDLARKIHPEVDWSDTTRQGHADDEVGKVHVGQTRSVRSRTVGIRPTG